MIECFRSWGYFIWHMDDVTKTKIMTYTDNIKTMYLKHLFKINSDSAPLNMRDVYYKALTAFKH